MIPKRIHYCWFGHNPKPKLAEKCINSWKKKCPDYEIIEWNEDNFDIQNAPLYVRQAYDAKKWAFVTDYVRLWAMVEYGGIYMDTDVQVIKPLTPFLNQCAFSGFEDMIHIPTGIIAGEKGFPLFKELLDYYDKVSFILPDGSYNLQTNVTTITNHCVKKGLVQDNLMQTIEGFTLYPKDFFCPISYSTGKLEKTVNTVTIHWFAASWQTTDQRKNHRQELKRIQRERIKDTLFHIPNRIMLKLLGSEKYETLKKALKR